MASARFGCTRARGAARLVVPIVLLLSFSAGADVVGPPPTDCPDGTEGDSCHGGAFCSPKRCTDTAACAAGTSCQEVKLCIAPINCGSHGMTSFVDSVKGSCPSGTCVEGTCRPVSVCMAGASAPGRGCSCAVAAAPDRGRSGAAGGCAALLSLLAAAALLSRRGPRRA